MDKEIVVKYISGLLVELENEFGSSYIDFDDNDLSDILNEKYYYPYKIRIELEGSSGGNCWDEDISSSVPYEAYGRDTDRPDLKELALQTIKKFNPNLSLDDSDKIISKVVSEKEERSHDYYGNYEDYVEITFNIITLISEIEKSLQS